MDRTMMLCEILKKCNRNLLTSEEWDRLQRIKVRNGNFN